MFIDFNYPAILTTSRRAAWELDDAFGPADWLDFARPFLPEGLARTGWIEGLNDRERLLLNQVRAHEYLSMFGLIEEFILPFVLDHARPQLPEGGERVLALLQFAEEEEKHIRLFRRFHDAFVAGFGYECGVIGPSQAIADEVLGHDPLAVALFVLMIEWTTQDHYVRSVRDEAGIDPLFARLLRFHWIEEAQHAKIDTLIVQELASGMSEQWLLRATDSFLSICRFIDEGLRQQARLNFQAFEQAAGRNLPESGRDEQLERHHQSLRATYLGAGFAHPRFRETVKSLSPAALQRIDAATSQYN